MLTNTLYSAIIMTSKENKNKTQKKLIQFIV